MKRTLLTLFLLACLLPSGLPQAAYAQAETSYHPLGEWRMITSKYGYRRNPFNRRGKGQFHKGIDLDIKVGDPVYAWRAGEVVYTGFSKISGNLVNIKHSDGYISKYHHLKRILARKGERVNAGQQIAEAGRSGKVTGPHLHFTITRHGNYLDPYEYLRESQRVNEHIAAPKERERQDYREFAVKSLPVAGKVYLDGEYQGQTPLQLRLDYGEYFIEIDPGEGYETYTERLWVGRNSDYVYTARLQREGAGITIEDLSGDSGADDDFAEVAAQLPRLPTARRFTGLLANATLLNPDNQLFAQRIGSAIGFDAGVGGFLAPSLLPHVDQYVDVRFTMLGGSFRGEDFFFVLNNSNPSSAATLQRLDDFQIFAGSVGYYLSPQLSNRLALLAGGELTYGVMDIRSFTQEEALLGGTGSPQSFAQGDGELLSSRITFFAPAWTVGAMLFLNERLGLMGKYQRTFSASDTEWSGFKIGLMTNLVK